MCGRFAQTIRYEKVMRDFDVHEITAIVEEIQAKYNCAPGQRAMVVSSQKGQRILEYLGWGITRIVKDEKTVQLINIRMESYREKPSVHALRCVIPVDGFYEWHKSGKKSQPYYFYRRDGQPIVLAGLCEKSSLSTSRFAIVTIPACGVIAAIHHRMPCVLPQELTQAWLTGDSTDTIVHAATLSSIDTIVCHQVSDAVNNVHNDSPACCEQYAVRTLFPLENDIEQ